MRFLNTTSLELREFFEKDIPSYAILSHRWEKDEVLYQDMVPSAERSETRKKYGYTKLHGSCSLAKENGHQWIWIDTCCIDKSSSAELTEAINSMYQWYEAAQVCYAYLSDVNHRRDFTESAWFTRGWTLQELVAPDQVLFYSKEWSFLGTKRSLVRSIATKTGVDMPVLMGGDPLEMSVARRMYWASHRVTTRVEDEAYCLLGLFGVNMPLIYGEGGKAFRRLQEEIIRVSDDQSILAWYATDESDGVAVDFLASRASAFLESGDIAARPYLRAGTEAMSITSRGLSLELPILSFRRDETAMTEEEQTFGEVIAILDCQMGSIPGTFPSIRLRRHPHGIKRPDRRQYYYRVISSGFQSLFSAERTQVESCDLNELRDETKSVIGIDFTQLDQDVYKKSLGQCDEMSTLDRFNSLSILFDWPSFTNGPGLDRTSDYAPWRLQQITISPPMRTVSKQRLTSNASSTIDQGSWAPWSLLLASQAEADQTAFWLVRYVELYQKCQSHLKITDVYPPERFDRPLGQVYTAPIPQKYYSLSRFKVVDAIIELRLSTYTQMFQGLLSFAPAKLLIGRQASSRRQIPEPWCQFAVSPDRIRDYAEFITQYEAGCSAADGPRTTDQKLSSDISANPRYIKENPLLMSSITEIFSNITMRASVIEKEISGVLYYLVTVETVGEHSAADKSLVLQRQNL